MKKRCRRAAAAAAVLALAAGGARANNLQITNVTVLARDGRTAWVQFDVEWENSWRYANGGDSLYYHDAAWVFFKVLPDGQADWQHVTLEGTGTNPTGYAVGTGTGIELVVPADRVGMLVRRSGDGEGTTAVGNVRAVWNFATNGLVKTDQVKIRAFGVEMVYVAQGSFRAGNTNGIINSSFHAPGNDSSPIPISSTNAFTIYWGAGDGNNAIVPNSFPNGYAPLYCMKYEITQGQYADFLNTLTRGQQAARGTVILNHYMPGQSSVSLRNTVRLTGDPGEPHPRVYTTVTRDRACNFLHWADGAAFADWAGLRPMTELEFEKACRGPLDPVPDEYAFGASGYTPISGLQGTDGSGSEYYTAGNLVVAMQSSMGAPVRAGVFATPTASRVAAGAAYWGIMEMSGNVWEQAVTVGHATGRAFTGLHGNGALTAAGGADVANWPGATGSGHRGGDFSADWFSSGAAGARVSDRTRAASNDAGGCTSAPAGARCARRREVGGVLVLHPARRGPAQPPSAEREARKGTT
jgi:formylglycine-generating enzyme required for sulfatase activity